MKPLRCLWLLAVLALPLSPVAAQDAEFHPPALASDPTAPETMRDLAGRILPVYQENNTDRYLSNLSAMQMVADNYTAAIGTRQSLRERRQGEAEGPDGRAVLYDIYAQARASEAETKAPFAEAFAQSFRDTLAHLNDQDAYAVTTWREPALRTLEAAVQSSFDRHRAKGSISVADGVDLIRTFQAFDALRKFGPLLPALNAEDEQRRYVAEDRVVINTPTGGHINALVVRPKNSDQPLPALLEFTIYVNSPNYAKESAAHGYAGIVAYTRETPDSPYRVAPFETEGEDAVAVIDWITRQPWSDGRVAMYGAGYSGFTQWAAARRLPPALKAIATSSATAPGVDFPMRGSVFRNVSYRWAYNVTNKKGWDDTYNDARWRALEETWYRSGKAYFEFDRTENRVNRYFHRWIHHPSYDGFWRRLLPYRKQFAAINIPVLTTAGYYGGDLAGALYYFTEHLHYDANADDTLLVGPFDDGAMERPPLADLRGYQIDSVAQVDLRRLRYQWFDFVLKGAAKPALLADRVNYEVMGANEWHHAASIEAMASEQQRFFLDAAMSSGAHLLAQQKPAEQTFTRQTVSLTDRSDAAWMPAASLVTQELPAHDSLRFVSEPLPNPFELNGRLSGTLDFTINKQDVDLSVALYELLPSGDYLALFDPAYAFRASYAEDRAHRHLLKDGERQRLSFHSERLTSRKLQAGSRLVVVLAVNKRADQQINYGSGNDVSAESIDDALEPINIRWYSDSFVDMPIQR
jgi:uncharacterized protein